MMGRLAYAALFAIALPVLLIAWGARLDSLISLPVYGSPMIGWPVAIVGVALMLAATKSFPVPSPLNT